MSNEEHIRSFLENKLSPAQEQDFLISLAADEKLSHAFKTEVTLLQSVAKDIKSISPPHHVQAALFASLGIATVHTAAARASSQTPARGTSLTKLLFITFAASALSFIAGYFINQSSTENARQTVVSEPVQQPVETAALRNKKTPEKKLRPVPKNALVPSVITETAIHNSDVDSTKESTIQFVPRFQKPSMKDSVR